VHIQPLNFDCKTFCDGKPSQKHDYSIDNYYIIIIKINRAVSPACFRSSLIFHTGLELTCTAIDNIKVTCANALQQVTNAM
jgi:hypothetical protein